MVLSDVDIQRYIAEGKIKISPLPPAEQFGSCSVDFKLGNEFNVFEHSRNAYIDLRENKGIDGLMKSVIVPTGEPFILQPREFVLAITEETVKGRVKNILAKLNANDRTHAAMIGVKRGIIEV